MILSNTHEWKYKGASISGYYDCAFNNPYVYQTIDYLKKCGVNAIQVVITWYLDDYSSVEIYKHRSKSVNDKDLIKIIKYIHEQGLMVNLNPHIDSSPRNSSEWRAKIVPYDVQRWFENYRKFLTHFLKISIRNHVELFTIGTEMISMTRPEYYHYWYDLVSFLRNYDNKSFKGKLVYLADRTEIFGMPVFFLDNKKSIKVEPLDSSFWELFDYVSFSIFYEVGDSGKITPDVDSVIKSWKDIWIIKLENWRKKMNIDQKVLIGEVGYRSIDWAHIAPSLHYKPGLKQMRHFYNEEMQVNCYEGMFRSLNTIDWIEGIFLWEEVINSPPLYMDKHNTKYSIINKEAAQIIARYYQSPDAFRKVEDIELILIESNRSYFSRFINFIRNATKSLNPKRA